MTYVIALALGHLFISTRIDQQRAVDTALVLVVLWIVFYVVLGGFFWSLTNSYPAEVDTIITAASIVFLVLALCFEYLKRKAIVT